MSSSVETCYTFFDPQAISTVEVSLSQATVGSPDVSSTSVVPRIVARSLVEGCPGHLWMIFGYFGYFFGVFQRRSTKTMGKTMGKTMLNPPNQSISDRFQPFFMVDCHPGKLRNCSAKMDAHGSETVPSINSKMMVDQLTTDVFSHHPSKMLPQ